jgi:acyl-CoA reductase-like NAD-dependent aldehyde dehydrogenase
MAREPITDAVVSQLREAIATGEVDDPVNRFEVGALAQRRELSELARFIVDADAATYYEAVVRARESDGADIEA